MVRTAPQHAVSRPSRSGSRSHSDVGDLRTVEVAIEDSRGNRVAHKTIDLRGRTEYRSRNEVVLSMSRVYVYEAETYSVRIHAEDAEDHADDFALRDVRAPGAVPA